MIDGLPWLRESRVNIEIVTKANVTGVKGRFVTPSGQRKNGGQTPIKSPQTRTFKVSNKPTTQ